jgi:hypothetical protein
MGTSGVGQEDEKGPKVENDDEDDETEPHELPLVRDEDDEEVVLNEPATIQMLVELGANVEMFQNPQRKKPNLPEKPTRQLSTRHKARPPSLSDFKVEW